MTDAGGRDLLEQLAALPLDPLMLGRVDVGVGFLGLVLLDPCLTIWSSVSLLRATTSRKSRDPVDVWRDVVSELASPNFLEELGSWNGYHRRGLLRFGHLVEQLAVVAERVRRRYRPGLIICWRQRQLSSIGMGYVLPIFR